MRDSKRARTLELLQLELLQLPEVPRSRWPIPTADRHDVRSLDVARLAHFTHCGKPPAKVNGRYDACALLHREWRETWARVAAESGVVA